MVFKGFFGSNTENEHDNEIDMNFIDEYNDDHLSDDYDMHASESGDISRIVTVHPEDYSDAKKVGEAFRENVPVIMNLTHMNSGDAQRMLDFASGLIFGLHGDIERITNRVYLISPAYVEIAKDND